MEKAKHPKCCWFVPSGDLYLVEDNDGFVVFWVVEGKYAGGYEHPSYYEALEAVAHSLAGMLNQMAANHAEVERDYIQSSLGGAK